MMERNAYDYKIMHDLFRDTLSEKVTALIDKGWQPQGGVSVTGGNGYIQAMVRYPELI